MTFSEVRLAELPNQQVVTDGVLGWLQEKVVTTNSILKHSPAGDFMQGFRSQPSSLQSIYNIINASMSTLGSEHIAPEPVVHN